LRNDTKAIRIAVIILSLLVVAAGAFVAGRNFPREQKPSGAVIPVNTTPESSSNLSLLFFGAPGILNTYPPDEYLARGNNSITFHLSPEEVDQIIQKIIEIDFFKLPYDCRVRITTKGPYPTLPSPLPLLNIAYVDITYRGQSNKVFWSDTIEHGNTRTGLRELINLISDFIESSPEYKSLPPPPMFYH
jgi:hypothetical protein